MYLTIFKIAWPLLQRLLAKRAAEYLDDRRQQRHKTSETREVDIDCPPCPPANMAFITDAEASSDGSIWFALSGILLGTAFSLMIYVMLQDNRTHL